MERWLLEEVPLHVTLAIAHALFSSSLFSFGECGKNLALKVKKSPAVIIFLLALEHLLKEKLVVCEQANGADKDTPH